MHVLLVELSSHSTLIALSRCSHPKLQANIRIIVYCLWYVYKLEFSARSIKSLQCVYDEGTYAEVAILNRARYCLFRPDMVSPVAM